MKKALVIAIPLLLLIGGGAAAFFLGLIPGTKKPAPTPAASATAGDKKDPTKEVAKKEVAPPLKKTASADKSAAQIDPQKGNEKLADLWNQMDTEALVKITADWKDPDLVKVLATMDDGKVAELMTAIAKDKPSRASKLSKQLQQLASVVAPAAGA